MTFEFDAILFDLDGTLISSIAAVDRAWTAWSLRNGFEPEGVLSQIHGRRAVDSLSAIAPHLDLEAEDAWLRERETSDTEGVYALPGAPEFVAQLTCPWAVVTSGTSDVATARLRAAGLPTPAGSVFGEDVENGKPAPDPFLLGAQRLGIPAARCLVFEDTLAGIRSGHAAGMKVIALATTHPADALGEADAVVSGFAKILFEQGPTIKLVQ